MKLLLLVLALTLSSSASATSAARPSNGTPSGAPLGSADPPIVTLVIHAWPPARRAPAVPHAGLPAPPRALAAAIVATFPRSSWWRATCEAWVESHYNRLRDVAGASWSPTGDHGFWQINYAAHHRPGESEWSFHLRLRSALANARAAFGISHGGRSWWAWSTYAAGDCR